MPQLEPNSPFKIGDRVWHRDPDGVVPFNAVGNVIAQDVHGDCVAWDDFTGGHMGPTSDSLRRDCWWHVHGQIGRVVQINGSAP